MSQPAARLGDMHTCPMSDGPKPHVGGPILPPCAVTVLIGGMPAATVTDKCVCVSPAPDVIVRGSFGVLIGGKPAARVGDQTAHGGVITLGCLTVLIGDVAGGDLATALTNVLNEINSSDSVVNCGNIIDAAVAFLSGQGINPAAAGRDGSFAAINNRMGTNINFNNPTNFNAIYQDLQNRGPGSMTLVGVSYAGGGSHVVVAANVNGQVGIMEGQTWNPGQPNQQSRGFITGPAAANARYNAGGGSTIAASPIP